MFNFAIRYKIKFWVQRYRPLDYFKDKKVDKNKSQAYIFLAADYGNLGDVAITYAQKEFIVNNTDYEVIEIPISRSIEGFHFVLRNIKPGDLMTTVGGGNMGDMYDKIEFIRQMVIKLFPNNKIISFPQTIEFSDTEKGRKHLKKAQSIYNRHSDFHMIGRERTSFNIMREKFPNINVITTPDIVLSLNQAEPLRERKGVIICMRKDQEKKLSENQEAFILNEAKRRFGKVEYHDTHIGGGLLSLDAKYKVLFEFWDRFRGAELVITDRLHGMIFCHITNTPCLVFQNSNHKVRETYEWIKQNNNIMLIKEFNEKEISNFFLKESFGADSKVSLEEFYIKLKQIL